MKNTLPLLCIVVILLFTCTKKTPDKTTEGGTLAQNTAITPTTAGNGQSAKGTSQSDSVETSEIIMGDADQFEWEIASLIEQNKKKDCEV